MRLVIDMQGAQSSGSRNRGIGRYTTSLTRAILQLGEQDEVFIVLNGSFGDTIEIIRAEFADLLPAENIRVWMPQMPCSAATPQNKGRRQAAELIREAFIAALRPDAVLVTSLFEGVSDDAVTSVNLLTTRFPVAVVLYDLIPLIHRDIYLGNPVVEAWYLNKVDHLRRASLLLSISASSGEEAIDYLGFERKHVVNISTACDTHFHPMRLSEIKRVELTHRYGLHRPFVMYTGGIDHRKNIEGLIRAYAALPHGLRAEHQLAVVCSLKAVERERIEQLGKTEGLVNDELVLTGFVPEDDLVSLYNACKMFVFPSWHEGFGLPALEAMACGRAVIGANTSSVPEVIGRPDALFDPHDDKAITAKMAKVLSDDVYRSELEMHGLQQASSFSWLQTAQVAWDALRQLPPLLLQPLATLRRPRLAFLSPVPCGKSGIADYSAELLPELARHYQIDVVKFQDEPVTESWLLANCPVRSVEWFRAHATEFDRVLYHFGNSHFHSHMFALLHEIPGVVVLHDFFLSGILAHMEALKQDPGCWSRALLESHGWPAVQMRHTVKDTADAVWAYPCNLPVLQAATGLIVHSENSIRLAAHWYGQAVAKDWSLVPLARVPAFGQSRDAALEALGVAADDFVVCSFGILGRTKLNHRLLQAWLASPLAACPQCRLVFVGQNEGGAYGEEMLRTISDSGAAVTITGWVGTTEYRQWLAVADVAVQLRTHSRGETSAAVLDCMNIGMATIVNAHGSMADLPNNCVYKLCDDFTDEQLVYALTVLWQNESQRLALGQHARQRILNEHQPRKCADLYRDAIENFYTLADKGPRGVIDVVNTLDGAADEHTRHQVVQALVDNFPPSPRRPHLLIDVSELLDSAAAGSNQAIVLSLLREMLLNPPDGWHVEAVYGNPHDLGYVYARRFTCGLLGVRENWTDDEVVEVWCGDIFIALDLNSDVLCTQATRLHQWHARGIKLYAMLHDVSPRLFPIALDGGTDYQFQQSLAVIAGFDGVFAVSKGVVEDYLEWLVAYGPRNRTLPLQVHYLESECDTNNAGHTTKQIISILNGRQAYRYWLSDGQLVFWGNDARLSTQVGLRKGRCLHSSGKAGYLIFGPYLPLSVGRYKVVIAGTAKRWSGDEVFDISCLKSAQKLLHANITCATQGEWRMEFWFDLDRSVDDFESRLWVSDKSDFNLAILEIISMK